MKTKNLRAGKACAWGAAMLAMAMGAQARTIDFGTVSPVGVSFSTTPLLPALTNDNRALRTVDIDNTYTFALATQSALTATLTSTSIAGMGGVVGWNLSYSLLDAQSNVLATGVLDPTPVITKGGQCQTVQGQQVNCTDTYSAYTFRLAAANLQAGQYQLRVTGTETAQNYGGFDVPYGGTVIPTAVPEPGTAMSLGLGLLGLACAVRRRAVKAG